MNSDESCVTCESTLKEVLSETIEVNTPACPGCGEKLKMVVSKMGYYSWRRGELIQCALPELSVDARERLMTGWCPKCWGKFVNVDDEDDIEPWKPEVFVEGYFSETELTHKDGPERR